MCPPFSYLAVLPIDFAFATGGTRWCKKALSVVDPITRMVKARVIANTADPSTTVGSKARPLQTT